MNMTNRLINIATTIIAMTWSTISYGVSPPPHNWMSYIHNSTALSEIVIPGTHDSAANLTSQGKTQNTTIKEQLKNGVRFLDIRVIHIQGALWTQHGPFTLHRFKPYVWDTITQFLDKNPNETVIMSLKEEDNLNPHDFWHSTWKSEYYAHPTRGKRFYKGAFDQNTTLEQVRGKIVLYDRIGGYSSFKPNSTYVDVQDEYELKMEFYRIFPSVPFLSSTRGWTYRYDLKWNHVNGYLEQAKKNTPKQFWVNYLNANYNGFKVDNNADYQNPKMKAWFIRNKAHAFGSIIIMDFPQNNQIQTLIDHSMRHYGITTIGGDDTDGYWGDWGGIARCPKNQYVYGYRLKSEPNQNNGDDTSLNGIQLFCTIKSNLHYTTIESKNGRWGTWGTKQYCIHTPVKAFKMRIEAPQGSNGDDSAANDIELLCDYGKYISASVNTHWGSWTQSYHCPYGQAVSGLTTRVESDQGRGDDTALNGLRLICSDY